MANALDELKDFVNTKILRRKTTADSEARDHVHNRPDLVPGEHLGFPFANYAYSKRINQDVLTIPRLKYTYIVEFHVNPQALDIVSSVTNLKGLITDNKIYIQLKKIDHPKPKMNFETMRSYNKYVKVPKTMEYPPASMTFDDDSTSMAVALWKEYFNFYNHSGDLGWEMIENPSLEGIIGNKYISNDQPGVGYQHLVWNGDGADPRIKMDERFSMGMKLKADHKRHFFDAITIYDLGTEPDSVNVYYYYHPVITSFDHQELDTEDRTSKVEINMQFEYENYYFVLGRSRDEISDTIAERFGVRPPPRTSQVNVKDTSHGQMLEPIKTGSIPVSLANPDPQTPTPQIVDNPSPNDDGFPIPQPPRPQSDVEREIERLTVLEQKIRQDAASGLSPADEQQIAEINSAIDELQGELNEGNVINAAAAKTEQNAPSTKSATENTEKLIPQPPPVEESTPLPLESNLSVGGLDQNQWEFNRTKNVQLTENYSAQLGILNSQIKELSDNGASAYELELITTERDLIAIRRLQTIDNSIEATEAINEIEARKRDPGSV